MKTIGAIVMGAALSAGPAFAQDTGLKPELAPLAFLIGHWTSADGQVQATGARAVGTSVIEPAGGGAALLRRDHTDLTGADGKPAGTLDQVMMIYSEAGALRADYTDGVHVIHYRQVESTPGRSVVLTSPESSGTPRFRLTYQLVAPNRLMVGFAMALPGGAWRDVATGVLNKSD